MIDEIILRMHPKTVVFDVETTGWQPSYGHRVCEIGLVVLSGRQIVDSYETLIDPERYIPRDATEVHHITDEDVEQAPYFRDIFPNLMWYMRDAIVVAHNARFDLSFLENEIRLAKSLVYGFPARVICTMNVARSRFGKGQAALDTVCARLGIRNANPYRAISDAKAAAKVLLHFLWRGGASVANLEKMKEDGDVVEMGFGRRPRCRRLCH